MTRMPSLTVLWTLVAAGALGGCATAQRPDPLEPMNRKVFAFNEAVDRAVIKPVATRYVDVTHEYVRTSIGNFFGHLRDAWSAVNLFLQGRPKDGLDEVLRFSVNTVFGAAGIMDVATPMGLRSHRQDLGQTLGHWGVKPGAYLVLPLLGPSSLRDVTDLPVAIKVQPEALVEDPAGRAALTALDLVDKRASLLPATRMRDQIALDPYTFTRDAYLQRRQSLIDAGRTGEGVGDGVDNDALPPLSPDDEPPAAPGPTSAAPVSPDTALGHAGDGPRLPPGAGPAAYADLPIAGAALGWAAAEPQTGLLAERAVTARLQPLAACAIGRCRLASSL